MNFGEKVKHARKQIKLSQSELAQKIGVSTRTVQSYEAGTSYPKQRDIYQKLADIFKCDTNYLLTEDAAFISDASRQYGKRGAKQAQDLISEISGLFAGGELAQEDKDEMMRAIQEAYWIAKENNRKYVPKKYWDSESES